LSLFRIMISFKKILNSRRKEKEKKRKKKRISATHRNSDYDTTDIIIKILTK
jgi:hypothetical protein